MTAPALVVEGINEDASDGDGSISVGTLDVNVAPNWRKVSNLDILEIGWYVRLSARPPACDNRVSIRCVMVCK